ncbi:MAG: DUF2807 domain-containing protein [Bacteroidia bacterium]|nr:DUF2807 domain-containing protein [Bacteroidia bacterium]
MKNLTSTLLFLFGISLAHGQESDKLKPFTKIIAGPHIALTLENGPDERIQIKSNGLEEDKIIYFVKGDKLHIHLRDARNFEKQRKVRRGSGKWKTGMYNDIVVHAHVTYRNLEKLVTKGEQDITVNGSIQGKRFKYKSFGDQDVEFANLETNIFRAKLYGTTNLKIKKGKTEYQRYKLYGEHDIDVQNVNAKKVSAASFGDLDLEVNSDLVLLTSFGTARIDSRKPAVIRKGIVIGETSIN